MKILVISREYEPMIAGVSKYISEIAKRLTIEKTIIALRFKGRGNRRVVEITYPKFIKKRAIKAVYFVVASVLESLRQKFDVVVGNAFTGSVAGVITKLISRKPLVSIIYDVDFLEKNATEYGKVNGFVRKHAIGLIISLSDRIVVDSEKVRRDILRFYGTGPKRIVSISAGASLLKRFKKIDKRGRRVILFVGNMAEKKGLTDLANAMKVAVEKFPDVELWLVGPDSDIFAPYRNKLKGIVSGLGISNHVKFIGVVKYVEPYYDACDFLVLPSHHSEGFGLPIIEAAHFGKPSVASKIFEKTGVINNKTGLVVPEKNPRKLADAMIKLLKNKKLCVKLGRNANKFIKKFDWDESARKFEGIVKTCDWHEN